VAGGVEPGDGGARGDGLAGADLAGEYPDGVFVDEPGQPGDGFLVRARLEQLSGREVATERGVGEPVFSELGSRRCWAVAMWSGAHGEGQGRDAGVDGGGAPVDLGELVVGACEADVESFGFAEPAFAFGFGDAGG
jgi:hypothetical protein